MAARLPPELEELIFRDPALCLVDLARIPMGSGDLRRIAENEQKLHINAYNTEYHDSFAHMLADPNESLSKRLAALDGMSEFETQIIALHTDAIADRLNDGSFNAREAAVYALGRLSMTELTKYIHMQPSNTHQVLQTLGEREPAALTHFVGAIAKMHRDPDTIVSTARQRHGGLLSQWHRAHTPVPQRKCDGIPTHECIVRR